MAALAIYRVHHSGTKCTSTLQFAYFFFTGLSFSKSMASDGITFGGVGLENYL